MHVGNLPEAEQLRGDEQPALIDRVFTLSAEGAGIP